MLHLQGDLQNVFDALFDLGVIEPMLKKDWRKGLNEMSRGSQQLARAIKISNTYSSNRSELLEELGKLDKSALEILAMEVAREYADFQTRESLQ